MNLPDLQSLRCFEAAATRLSFRLAAGDVGLSPAALGQRIAALEAEWGRALFARTSRSVQLTPFGEHSLPLVRDLLERAFGLRDGVLAEESGAPFALTLATRYELGLSWLVPMLPALEKQRPGRRIHLSFGSDVVRRVTSGVADAGVTSARFVEEGIRYEVLHDEDYVMVGASSLLDRHPLRSEADAPRHTLIDSDASLPLFRYFLDAWSPERKANSRSDWNFESTEYMGTIAAILSRVLQEAGIAVLPRYAVAPLLEKGELRVLFAEIALETDHFRLLWREGHPYGPEFHRLAAELRESPLRL